MEEIGKKEDCMPDSFCPYYEKYLILHITENIMVCRCRGVCLRDREDISDKHQQTITETIKTGVDLLYKTRK